MRTAQRCWTAGALALSLLIAARPAGAQSVFATLVGVVTDASGAVVPGATVTVTNLKTAVEREIVSDGAGAFQVSNLDAGDYLVRVSLSGFADSVRQLTLLARQIVRADAQLIPGARTEQVEVRAERTIISTESPTIDTSTSGDEISKLALNFRATNNTSPIVVATLAQGVQQDRAGQISVAGALPFMTSFSIDGISTQRTRGGGASRELFPSVESIEEFRVSAANNNAEFMQVTDITTTSKSGTNALHGSGFWFFQDSALDGVTQFTPRDAAGEPIKPEVRTNTFGVTAGGPVVRNRAFFFATFEGVRRPNQTTLSQLVPPVAFRAGDLSSISRQLINPFTGAPYSNNQIPVHPASARVLQTLYEPPTEPGTSLANSNFITNYDGNFTQNGFDVRGDQVVSDSQKLFARFTFKDVESTGANGTAWNTKQGEYFSKTEVRQLAGAHNWILSRSLLNEARAGWSYTLESNGYPGASTGAELMQSLGFTGLPPTPASGGLPSFEFGGDAPFISTGGAKPRSVLSRTYQISDNVTWITGRHAVKAGADWQYVEYKDQVTFFNGEEYGRYFFDGSYTGSSFGDFLVGLPRFTSYAQNAPDGNPYSNHWAFFAQDDWRVGSRLTINFGVRYDLRPPMNDRSNQLGNIDRSFPGGRVVVSNAEQLAQVPASVRAAVPNTPFVTADEVGLPDSLVFTDKNNINPRVGFAWRPFTDGRSVVRGGVGLYTVPIYGATNYSLLGVVTSDVPTFPNSRRADGTYVIQFPNVFPTGQRAPGSNDFRRANQWDLQNPRTRQWSLTYERDMGARTGLRISYIGSHTTDLVWSPDLNQIAPNTQGYSALANTRPFTDWNVVTTRDNGARSGYNALGLELNRRTAAGLSFNSSYTYARHLTDSGGAVPGDFTAENGATVPNYFRTEDEDYGNAPFTRRHRWVSTFLWQLPLGRGRAVGGDMSQAMDALAGGWDLAGVLLVQSGPFLTPFFNSGTDPSGTGTLSRGFTSTQRPDQGSCDGNVESPTVARWFDASCFVRPGNDIGRFGNAPVGEMIGPGTTVFSLTIGKSFVAGGTSRVRFEVAMSNLFNIENLDIPANMNVTSSAFGRITRVQSVDQAGPRTVQFSLRYTF
jgi:hypothetical protein